MGAKQGSKSGKQTENGMVPVGTFGLVGTGDQQSLGVCVGHDFMGVAIWAGQPECLGGATVAFHHGDEYVQTKKKSPALLAAVKNRFVEIHATGEETAREEIEDGIDPAFAGATSETSVD